MTGLPSKWATDESLVDMANDQDKKTQSKSNTGKSDPLPSKWATSEPVAKNKKLQSQLATPPLSAGKNRWNHDRKGRRHIEKPQKIEQTQEVQQEDEGEEEEDLPAMTNAAKSFAARLGVGSSTPTENSDDFVTTDEEVTDEEVTYEEEVDEGPLEEPMSDAGKSLAQRLGMMNVGSKESEKGLKRDSTPKKDATSKKDANQRRDANPKRDLKKDTKRDQKKYEAPKRIQRYEVPKKDKYDSKRADEEKINKEVKEMFDRLEDTGRSWADLEDEL